MIISKGECTYPICVKLLGLKDWNSQSEYTKAQIRLHFGNHAIAMGMTLLSLLIFGVFAIQPLFYSALATLLGLFLCLLLFRKPQISWLYFFSVNLVLFNLTTQVYFLPEIHVEYLYVPMALGVLNNYHQRVSAILLVEIAVLFVLGFFFKSLFNANPQFVSPSIVNMLSWWLNGFLIVPVLVHVIHQRKGMKRYQSILQQQNDEIEQKTVEMLKLEKLRHENELLLKQKDIDLLQANNQLKGKIHGKVVEELKGIDFSQLPERQIKSLIAQLESQANTSSRIDLQQDNLDTANSDFHQKLTDQFPDLSKAEREIAVYIKLGLSSKEMASIRSTTVNSIDVTKGRLRKKCQVKTTEELFRLLNSIQDK